MGNVDEAFVRLYNETYDDVLRYVLLNAAIRTTFPALSENLP